MYDTVEAAKCSHWKCYQSVSEIKLTVSNLFYFETTYLELALLTIFSQITPVFP